MKRVAFPGFVDDSKLELRHGGVERVGKRKVARPLCSKRPIHVTMRSSLAVGKWSFRAPRNRRIVEALLKALSARYGIRVYRYAINGNHLHFELRGRTRRAIQSFFRVFPGRLASLITGAKKALPLGRRFWDLPVWTRILQWGKSFTTVASYVLQNTLEAEGLLPYVPRNARPKKL